MATNFKPALIVVDLQEDFCPPNGSLAVANGRDIIPTINTLLSLPFALKIATKDWHPADHISFASNHAGKKPFTDFTTIINPTNAAETYETRLWPVHCIQNTAGAELLPELDISKIDKVVEKGTVKEVEMYSAFYDPCTAIDSAKEGFKTVVVAEGTRGVDQPVTTWDKVKEELEGKGVDVVSMEGEEVAKVRNA
ncbi:Nicotinamide deamidase [Hyphodiscus hymeniophilus]|uniref:nicotinamidase n=1 Tax=Hyphodiscus hymeniophilus TaxID=353542 RepID=A0A9P6VP81_9HELO|nr:Nicotinamide deamidase [Hyphodiscus hymeniophilus]